MVYTGKLSEEIPVTVPEYPYDSFVIYLLPDGLGGLFRGSVRLADVQRSWGGWTIGETFCPGSLSDEAITAAIDEACAAGIFTLTRKETP